MANQSSVLKSALILLVAVGCFAAQQRPNGLYAIFNTSRGVITARLYEKDAPITVRNFVALAQGAKATRDPRTGKMVNRRLYDNITFHRVVRDEMIQSGDPTGTGSHNCGITIPDEFLPGLRFDAAGQLAMANTGAQDSGGCQFFITVNAVHQWNGKYAIFGVVVEGLDVASKINRAPLNGDKPVDPVKLISVTIERIGPEPVKKTKK
jgi:peptidyl-prolyl cis-trans isomerase A (cyclophilin A)